MQDGEQGGWLRLLAAAQLAGCGRTTLHRAAEQGELPYAVLDGVRYFLPDDVTAWAEARPAR